MCFVFFHSRPQTKQSLNQDIGHYATRASGAHPLSLPTSIDIMTRCHNTLIDSFESSTFYIILVDYSHKGIAANY